MYVDIMRMGKYEINYYYHAIDEATFDHILALALDTHSTALVLSTAIPRAGDWLGL